MHISSSSGFRLLPRDAVSYSRRNLLSTQGRRRAARRRKVGDQASVGVNSLPNPPGWLVARPLKGQVELEVASDKLRDPPRHERRHGVPYLPEPISHVAGKAEVVWKTL